MDLGRTLVFWVLILSRIYCSIGQVYKNVSRLKGQLLDDYDKWQRPVLDQSKSVTVNVSFTLWTLQDIDEVRGTFSVVSVPEMTWVDEKLRWDPALHDNITSLVFPKNRIWSTKLLLSNSNSEDVREPEDDIARVNAFGLVRISKRQFFEASCPINVRNYPFDTQVCYLSFHPLVYHPHEVTLQSTYSEAITSYYVENGEWTFSHSHSLVFQTDFDSVFVVILAFERRSSFVFVNVLLPILLMATMNILVFVIPPDAGERISYSVTVLLALAVYLTLVGDNLPRTSKPVPLVCYYLSSIVILSVSMCVLTIFNLRIYHKDENSKPPGWCRGLTNIALCRCCKNGRTSSTGKETNYKAGFDNRTDPKYPAGQDHRQETIDRVTWKNVSSALDIVLLIIYLLAAVIVNVYFIMKLQSFEQ